MIAAYGYENKPQAVMMSFQREYANPMTGW